LCPYCRDKITMCYRIV